MKKFIYVLGIILINVLLIGAIFKINHWPGAGVLLSLSMTLLVVGFFPLALIASYRSTSDKLQLHLYIIAYITVAFVIIGMLFKIMHWPGAGVMLIIGIPLPFILFLPFYIRYHNKIKAKSDKNFFGLIFFMIYMAIVSSFLAIDASRDVYEGYLPQIEKMTSQSIILEQRNDVSYASSIQLADNKSIKNDIELLKSSADDLFKVLESTKTELIIKSNQKNESFILNNKIDYYSLEGLSKRNILVSFINQKDEDLQENLIEKNLISFELAIKNLSGKYALKDLLHSNDNTYLLEDFRTNINKSQFLSKSMVANLSALTFMQNRVRFLEYQILYKIQN